METTVVGIASVESKDINTSQGAGTLYVIGDSLGIEYTTFDRDLAVQAAAYKGQNATISFDEKVTTKPGRDGQPKTYINRYLKSLGAAAAGTVVAQPAIVAQQDATLATAAPVVAQAPVAAAPVIHDREDSIARAVALKAAIESVAAIGLDDPSSLEVIALADFYLPWLKGEGIKGTSVENLVDAVGAPATQALTDTDDIPF